MKRITRGMIALGMVWAMREKRISAVGVIVLVFVMIARTVSGIVVSAFGHIIWYQNQCRFESQLLHLLNYLKV